MQANTFLSADYLDILFNNRNKIYGGYELRKNYNNRAIKALATVAVLVLIVFVTFFRKSSQPLIKEKLSSSCTLTLTNVHPIVIPPQPKIFPIQVTHNTTVKHTTFVVQKDDDVHEKIVENSDLVDKQIGITNLDGDATDDITGTHATRKGDPIEIPIKSETSAVSKVLSWVSQMPDFDGDLQGYLSRQLIYPMMARENNIQGKVSVRFVVNEDGSIDEAKIIKGIGGGCDEEALRVVRNMPPWKAGRNNGVPVRVYVILPINFQLE